MLIAPATHVNISHTIHNLHYYQDLMCGLRKAIQAGNLAEFRAEFQRQRAVLNS